MMLTTKGRYAVMAVVDLATQPGNQPIKLNDIATRQNVKLQYLEQIFNKLKRSNIVNSQKGPGGGYLLARNANQITIAEIIEAAEESIKMTRCATDKKCIVNNQRCLTHHLWRGLEKNIRSYLDDYKLSDFVTPSKMVVS